MIISEINIYKIRVPLRVPFRTALRRVEQVEDVVVELVTDDGKKAYGEAPPTGVITGDTAGGIIAAVTDHIAPVILGKDPAFLEPLAHAVQACMVHNTSAKAACDMALWDLYGQLMGVPVYAMLGASRKRITTDITISVNDPDTMAADAADAVRRGYDCIKVKVGIEPAKDTLRLKAVRSAAGKDVRIRIDANQAWKPKEAVRILNRMQEMDLGIELAEQPVKAADFEGLQYVTANSDIPVLADESVFSPQDALRVMQYHAADMVNIKLMKCGGITNALKIASAAEIYGMECMLGCMLETKIACNAAVHLACARGIFTKIDLDGPVLCSEDPVMGGAVFDEQVITVSDAPGLGISGIDPDYLTPVGNIHL